MSLSYAIFIANLVGIAFVSTGALALLTTQAGLLSIGHVAFVGVGAFSFALAFAAGILPGGILGLAVGALLGGVAATAIAYVLARPMLRLRGDGFVLASLGLILAFGAVVAKGAPNGIQVNHGVGPLEVGLLVSAVVLVAAFVLSWQVMSRGAVLRAQRDGSSFPAVCGVNVGRTLVDVFAIAGGLAGAAGALQVALLRSVHPDTFALSGAIVLVAATLLGGKTASFAYGTLKGSVQSVRPKLQQATEHLLGAFFGAAAFALVPIVLRPFVSGQAKAVVFGMALVALLLWLPREGSGFDARFDGGR